MQGHTKYFGSAFLAFIAGVVTWSLFGNRIKSRINKSEVWRELKAMVEEDSAKIKNLTKSAYDDIVDAAADKYSRVQGISRHELRDLVDDLKLHWEKIKDAWRREEVN